MDENKRTLYEILAGIIFLAVIECIVGSIITKEILRFSVGGLFGAAAGALYIIDMYKALDRALDMDENSAEKFSRKMTTRRLISIAIVFGLGIVLSNYVSVLAVFLGVMNVKFSVYLQPLTNKFLSKKFFDKGR